MSNTTVSYTATPTDSRCQYWAVHIPAGYARGIDLANTASLRPLGFVRKNADLELSEGEAVLASEAVHHAKNRGYAVALHVVVGGTLRTIRPDAELKAAIKSAATEEQWDRLRHGSGDVAACLRALLALEMFGEPQLRAALPKTATAKYGPVVEVA